LFVSIFFPPVVDAGGDDGGLLSVGEDGSSSEGSMANQRQSKCLCCGDKFTVDVRNRGRQKYCPKRSCRAAGKAARQRRWLAKRKRSIFPTLCPDRG
jgi:hypothetical protein